MDTRRRLDWERTLGHALSVTSVLLLLGVNAAAAFDIPVEGRKVVAKSEPAGEPRFVFRGKNLEGAFFDPSTGTTTVIATEVDCDGAPIDELCVATATSGVIELDPTLWTPLGQPAGIKGYRYRDRDATRGGVRAVLLHATGKLSVKAVGDDWPLEPTGAGNGLLVRVTRDNVVYCAEFGGIEKHNQPGLLSLKGAPAPPACRGACGNGLVENGEGCDPAGGASCDASCRLTCTTDPGSTLIACSSANDGSVALAGEGDAFLLAYTQVGPERTRVRAVRFDSLGQVLDATPLLVSDGITTGSSPLAVADDNGFHVLWTSESEDYGLRRGVPFTGSALDAITAVATQGPPGPGQCAVYGSATFGLGPSLSNGAPLVSRAANSFCIGTPWLVGIPGAGLSTGSFVVIDQAPASFARGASASAAVWRRGGAALPDPPIFVIAANRIEPSPLSSVLHLTETPSLAYQPVVAAVGDLFMVAWVTGSEVRGLRFMFPDTLLDGVGGFLIASLSGTAEAPAMTADGVRFAVAWRQGTAGDDELRAVHVDTDGTVEEPSPLLLASATAITDLGIAAGTSATWAAFATAEPSGARAMRIVEVP